MAALTPPATQNAPLAAPVIASISDMREAEQLLADYTIDLVATRSLTRETASPGTRRLFWDAVFANGWNTSEPIEHPGPLPGRRFTNSALHIGDLPPSREVIRKTTKDRSPIP
jgi:hypothetical protein